MELITANSHWLFLATGCIAVLLEIIIINRLKNNHHLIYSGLGKPNVLINFSIKKTKALNKYIIKREYKPLNDKILNVFGALFIINLIVAVAFIVLFSMRPE